MSSTSQKLANSLERELELERKLHVQESILAAVHSELVAVKSTLMEHNGMMFVRASEPKTTLSNPKQALHFTSWQHARTHSRTHARTHI